MQPLFTFYALPSGGKSKDAMVHSHCLAALPSVKKCSIAASFSCFKQLTTNSKHIHYKILPMTGFGLRTSGIWRDISVNWATTTAPFYKSFYNFVHFFLFSSIFIAFISLFSLSFSLCFYLFFLVLTIGKYFTFFHLFLSLFYCSRSGANLFLFVRQQPLNLESNPFPLSVQIASPSERNMEKI